MEAIGYFFTIIIGLLIGLFGGGGSILTVPVLVYLFAIPATLATTYSLVVVSITSLLAATPHVIKKQLSYSSILSFGIPSIGSLYLVRAMVLPAIPNTFQILGYTLDKNLVMMVFFAIIMLFAGSMMLTQKKSQSSASQQSPQTKALILSGIAEGFLTGMVGAGGGFIIVPIFMIFGKLSMKQAVANSLLLIGIKSLIGFLVSHNMMHLDVLLLMQIIGIALKGMLIGIQINKKLNAQQLKPIFAYFVLSMGILILIKELLVNGLV